MRSIAAGTSLGGNAGSLTGEIDLDQGVHGPSRRRGTAGEPLRGASDRDGLDHVGQGRHVVRAAGLERADEVPAHAGHLRVLRAQFLDVVLADVHDARVARPADRLGRARSCWRRPGAPRRRRARTARRPARCLRARRRGWPGARRGTPSPRPGLQNGCEDMERGAGSSFGQEAGEGRLRARNLPAPHSARPRGDGPGPSVLQEIRDIQVLLGIERDRRGLRVARVREHVQVLVGVVGEDRRKGLRRGCRRGPAPRAAGRGGSRTGCSPWRTSRACRIRRPQP